MKTLTHQTWQRKSLLALGLGVSAFLSAKNPAHAEVIVYEGNDWPEQMGWISTAFCDPPRTLIGGWLKQDVAQCPGDPLPGGQQESFKHDLALFEGAESFFLEWRMQTDGPASEIVFVAPASMVAAGDFGTNYHFTIARDQVRFIRDNLLPITFAGVEPELPHVYRLESYGAELYVWYIDGFVVDAGTPEGPFPVNDSAVISFRASCWFEQSSTRWDYIRFGVIPADGSGDYDSDSAATLFDYYFVQECVENLATANPGGPGSDAGPGCRFADFNADTDVDLADIAEFQNHFGAVHAALSLGQR